MNRPEVTGSGPTPGAVTPQTADARPGADMFGAAFGGVEHLVGNIETGDFYIIARKSN